jgi:hypothetical protein
MDDRQYDNQMWLNLLMDDRQCDNITKLKEKEKPVTGNFRTGTIFSTTEQARKSRHRFQTHSREQANSTGRTGHGTGTPERDQGRVGSAAGLATYYPPLVTTTGSLIRAT